MKVISSVELRNNMKKTPRFGGFGNGCNTEGKNENIRINKTG